MVKCWLIANKTMMCGIPFTQTGTTTKIEIASKPVPWWYDCSHQLRLSGTCLLEGGWMFSLVNISFLLIFCVSPNSYFM